MNFFLSSTVVFHLFVPVGAAFLFFNFLSRPFTSKLPIAPIPDSFFFISARLSFLLTRLPILSTSCRFP